MRRLSSLPSRSRPSKEVGVIETVIVPLFSLWSLPGKEVGVLCVVIRLNPPTIPYHSIS